MEKNWRRLPTGARILLVLGVAGLVSYSFGLFPEAWGSWPVRGFGVVLLASATWGAIAPRETDQG